MILLHESVIKNPVQIECVENAAKLSRFVKSAIQTWDGHAGLDNLRKAHGIYVYDRLYKPEDFEGINFKFNKFDSKYDQAFVNVFDLFNAIRENGYQVPEHNFEDDQAYVYSKVQSFVHMTAKLNCAQRLSNAQWFNHERSFICNNCGGDKREGDHERRVEVDVIECDGRIFEEIPY